MGFWSWYKNGLINVIKGFGSPIAEEGIGFVLFLVGLGLLVSSLFKVPIPFFVVLGGGISAIILGVTLVAHGSYREEDC